MNKIFQNCTRESLDVGKQDADVLIAMDVYPVELIRCEGYRPPTCRLASDIADHLLGDEIGQHFNQVRIIKLLFRSLLILTKVRKNMLYTLNIYG